MSSTGPTLGDEALGDGPALEDALARSLVDRALGTTLRMPANVLSTGDGSLPLAGCRVVTLRDAARQPPFEDVALLVASHVDTGRIYVARAFAQSTEASDPPPTPPDPGEGYTGSTFRIDVARRLGLQPEPGTFTVWLIVRSEASGPERVQVVKPAPTPTSGYSDPEVAKFIAEWRKRNVPKPRGADPASVWPPEAVFGNYPSYRAGAESPPLPQRGISLWTKRVLLLESNARWVLAGSFRLAVPRRHVVLEPVSGYPATAVLPITIVLTASTAAGPFVQHLRVPSKTPINARDDAPVVEGHFTLNLMSLPGMLRAPDTYFVYAVCGETMSHPAVTALVSEAMLAADS
jgi:hypothetical protein